MSRIPTRINQPRLHQYLWRHSDHRDQLELNARQLADILGYDHADIKRLIQAFAAQGRLNRLGHPTNRQAQGGPSASVVIYRVADPDRWNPDDPATHASRRRQTVKWG